MMCEYWVVGLNDPTVSAINYATSILINNKIDAIL